MELKLKMHFSFVLKMYQVKMDQQPQQHAISLLLISIRLKESRSEKIQLFGSFFLGLAEFKSNISFGVKKCFEGALEDISDGYVWECVCMVSTSSKTTTNSTLLKSAVVQTLVYVVVHVQCMCACIDLCKSFSFSCVFARARAIIIFIKKKTQRKPWSTK